MGCSGTSIGHLFPVCGRQHFSFDSLQPLQHKREGVGAFGQCDLLCVTVGLVVQPVPIFSDTVSTERRFHKELRLGLGAGTLSIGEHIADAVKAIFQG